MKKNKKGKDKKRKRKLARRGGYGTLAGIERSTEKPFWKSDKESDN